MNFAAATLLGMTLGQPPAPDYYPFNSRTLRLPIEYKSERAQLQHVQLFVSRDNGGTWAGEGLVTPDKTEFVYVAREDGVYWFHIVTVDLRGRKDPPDMTREPPALKVLVDTEKPVVQFLSGRRNGEEVVVEWEVRDKFANESATQVYFRAATAPESYWQEVTLPAGSRNGVRFPSGTTGAVFVKVVARDLAGNVTEATKEIAPVAGAASTSLTPGSATPPAPPPTLPVPTPNPAPSLPPPELFTPPPAPALPPGGTPTVAATSPGGPVAPLPPAVPPSQYTPPTNPVATATPPQAIVPQTPVQPAMVATATPGSPQPVPTFDPRNPVTPAGAGVPATSPPAPIPGTGAPAGPVVELSRAQVVGSLRFDLNYQVEQRGPSGISRVDLWVTRDDGRSWVWWSQHDGREAAVKVNLETRANTQPEGLYGFRLVPVSGAGLSDGTPNAGDAPDMRIVVDITPPVLKIFPPTSDVNDPTALVLQWEAADRNFGDDPITLEWSRDPTGPWYPVVTAEGVVQASSGAAAVKRLPNTGRYSWRVPTGLPPRVYLKVTARDAAGNAAEQVTREPLLIDLTKPRARIIGIGATPVVPRP